MFCPNCGVSAKCVSVDELSESGDKKWRATATLKTDGGDFHEIPVKVKLKEKNNAFVEIDTDKLSEDDPVLFLILLKKGLENMDESDFDL